MSRKDFEDIKEYSKIEHKKRVADNPRRIEYAIKQFKNHGIKYELKDKTIGHFHCYRKSDNMLFQFYASTGKIKGIERVRGIYSLIKMLER